MFKMALPQRVMDFLNENAQRESAVQPGPDDDLFVNGALDSFTLVDFVAAVSVEPRGRVRFLQCRPRMV